MGMEMKPNEVMWALLGRRTVIGAPEGMRCGGMSDNLMRKSVVPVSASVLIVELFERVGGEDCFVTELCLILRRWGQTKSCKTLDLSPSCQERVLPPATSVGVMALIMA